MFKNVWDKSDISSFDETIGDSVLFHYAGASRILSRDQMSEFIVSWRDAFPDLKIDDQFGIRRRMGLIP